MHWFARGRAPKMEKSKNRMKNKAASALCYMILCDNDKHEAPSSFKPKRFSSKRLFTWEATRRGKRQYTRLFFIGLAT